VEVDSIDRFIVKRTIHVGTNDEATEENARGVVFVSLVLVVERWFEGGGCMEMKGGGMDGGVKDG
jgi:hypothetical protein